jgi:outer membrane protein assembly factor BamB
MKSSHSLTSITALCFAALSSSLVAGDWPQILGPHRNGHADNESLVDSFPAAGPTTVWKNDVGSGFAGVAVTDETAFLFHRVGDDEILEALDVQTGTRRWRTAFPAHYVPTYTDDNGPRAVPLVLQGKVFVIGSLGEIRAVDLKAGKKLWERNTFDDYNSKRPLGSEPAEGYFGFGTSPIVEDNKLIVNVGGDRKQAGVVAFDLQTGKTLWTATDARASYSSPVAATIDGKRHLIVVTRFSVVSLDPANGKVRFQFPFGQRGPSATAANPLVLGDSLFVSASYGFGAVFSKIAGDSPTTVWESDDIMSSQYTTCVEQDGLLYGVHGRQDGPPATLRCFDPKTRKVHWSEEDFGYATLIKADGKLVILKTGGELVLAAAKPDAYRELARASLFNSETRALPALANGYLFARDTRTLKCVDIGKRK